MSPCFLGTWNPHFLRARDPLDSRNEPPLPARPGVNPPPSARRARHPSSASLLARAGIRGTLGASLHFLPARCGASPPVPARAGSALPPARATRAPSPSYPRGAARATPFLRELGSPATWGTSPTFCARGDSGHARREPTLSVLAARAPHAVPARAGPALPSASAARDPPPATPAHAAPRKLSLPARVVLHEPPGSCARGSSTPFPGRAGQPYPRHTRRQPPYLPARRSARHRFLGAWREPLPSCAGGAPRDWCPSLHRKGSPVEGRVSSTPKKGVPTRGPCVLNRVRRGPHSPAAGLNWACRGLDPWCARPGKERRVPTRGPGILTGRHRRPHPRAVRPLLRTQCSPLLGCAPSTAH